MIISFAYRNWDLNCGIYWNKKTISLIEYSSRLTFNHTMDRCICIDKISGQHNIINTIKSSMLIHLIIFNRMTVQRKFTGFFFHKIMNVYRNCKFSTLKCTSSESKPFQLFTEFQALNSIDLRNRRIERIYSVSISFFSF